MGSKGGIFFLVSQTLVCFQKPKDSVSFPVATGPGRSPDKATRNYCTWLLNAQQTLTQLSQNNQDSSRQ